MAVHAVPGGVWLPRKCTVRRQAAPGPGHLAPACALSRRWEAPSLCIRVSLQLWEELQPLCFYVCERVKYTKSACDHDTSLSVIQRTFIEHLLCVRYSANASVVKTVQEPSLPGACISVAGHACWKNSADIRQFLIPIRCVLKKINCESRSF